MVKLVRTLLVLSFVLTWNTLVCLPHAAGQQTDPRIDTAQTVSSEKFKTDFDKVCELVRSKFYDPKLGGVDWKKICETYQVRLGELKTKAEFESLVNKMLDELHASHAGYSTDEDIEFYMLPSVLRGDLQGHQVEHIGVMGRQASGEFLVAGVMDRGPADKAGIQAGDRLLLADGLTFSSAGSFRGKEGKPVKVEYRREGDPNMRSVMVTPVKQNILRAFLTATEKSARVLNIGGKRVGYVHLWTMANDAFHQTLDQLVQGKLHNTDGLILDLRDGYGGSPWYYADVFFRPDVSWEQQSRGSTPFVRYSGYGKPMVVLINKGTRSAKEFFSYEFKTTHRAKLVGTRTAGAFLGAGAFDVSKDGLLELPVLGLKVDGKLLEDNGVQPDIVVNPQATYSERDAQLLAGEQALLETIKKSAPVFTDTTKEAGAHRAFMIFD